MQRRQRAAGDQHQHEAGAAKREVGLRQFDGRLLLPVQHPAEIEDHQSEQIRRPAESREQRVSDDRANTPHAVRDLVGSGRLGDAWVGLIVGEQRKPEDERKHTEYVQRTLAESAMHLCR